MEVEPSGSSAFSEDMMSIREIGGLRRLKAYVTSSDSSNEDIAIIG